MPQSPSNDISRHRVLLVDDFSEVLQSLGRLLGRHYQVTCASSGAEGLAVLERGPEFSVVIADHDMPEMNGVEFLERVGNDHPATMRIMLSGVGDQGLPVQALRQSRIFRFLQKPAPAETLLEAIAAAIEVYESDTEEQVETGELAFSNTSLQELNCALEARIAGQRNALQCMHRFAIELNRVDDLQGIAEAAAGAVHETLEGRGVHVQIWNQRELGVECSRGPEMSTQMCSQPLTTTDGQVGEIIVDELSEGGRRLSVTEHELLAAIASITSVAVHNEFRRRERDEAQYATIVALARLSEQRDNETGTHLERVGLYCDLLARGLRERGLHSEEITDSYIRDLVRSAPLHDIGKVGIPDSILLKAGKLTAGEWEIMKTHSQIGASTLSSVIQENQSQSYLEMGRDIAWCHHEQWDGGGYPRGLVGEEIPLAARILALADVYDALTTVRPYKDAWTHAEALEWVREASGQQLDPDLVDVFLACSDRMNTIRERLADRREDLAMKPIYRPVRQSA